MSMREYSVKEQPRMRPTHPGEIVREDVLPALGLSVSEAARGERLRHGGEKSTGNEEQWITAPTVRPGTENSLAVVTAPDHVAR